MQPPPCPPHPLPRFVNLWPRYLGADRLEVELVAPLKGYAEGAAEFPAASPAVAALIWSACADAFTTAV